MAQFTIFFFAGKEYKTTIPADTSGEAQTKFIKWYDEVFKPKNNITRPLKVTHIQEVIVKNPLEDIFKDTPFGQAFKRAF